MRREIVAASMILLLLLLCSQQVNSVSWWECTRLKIRMEENVKKYCVGSL
jgi:hypothetical protein